MNDKRRVFILGAGASCPFGYPSGARLRELICHNSGFMKHHSEYLTNKQNRPTGGVTLSDISRFRDTFAKSHIKSIDLLMSKNPKLAPSGKYILAFEIFRAEKGSRFGEEAKWEQEMRDPHMSRERTHRREYCQGTADFIGGDWYSYVYGRMIEHLVGPEELPDFSGGELAFITFNYDRSLEHFLYESLRNSFTEAREEDIIRSLRQLKILHVYRQIAPLKWQDAERGIDHKPEQIDQALLQKAAINLKTIYEQEASSELSETQQLLARADEVFLLGFGYARENMDILHLPDVMSRKCQVYGTAYGFIEEERRRKALAPVHDPRGVDRAKTIIEAGDVDCLMLLRKYL